MAEPPLRQPPQDAEAEAAVLGAVLLDNHALDQIQSLLRSEDFYRESHRVIFTALVDLYARGSGLDTVTLYSELKAAGLLDQAGGPERLAQLTEAVPTTANAADYGRIVRDKSMLRRFITVASGLVEEIYRGVTDLDDFLDRAETEILAVADRRGRNDPESIRELLKTTFAGLETRMKNRSEVTGITTGFRDLDKLTAGLQPTDLIILAARPSMGKTALCLNIASSAALKGKAAVAVFSLEMSKEQLVLRMLSSHARVKSEQIRTGYLTQEDFNDLFRAADELSAVNLFIDDTPSITIMDLRSKCRRLKADHGLDMVIVDYLQLMRSPAHANSREQEISEISRSLKALAKELHVPVVALSQLNRSMESRANRRPMLSDLRESGAIEQDADIVMFIYRDEMYNPDTKDKGIAEVIIAKQRNGSLGTVRLAFRGAQTRFDNLSEDQQAPYAT